MQELKDIYPGTINVIRLKNKAQQPIRAVKLEFMSVKARNEILEAREITVSHLKYKVVEFFAQASVLICSNCSGIGHFRKSCPQKNEAALTGYNSGPEPAQSNNQHISTTTNELSYANVVKKMPSNSNAHELIFKKLDSILTKMEEESNATCQSLIEFKQEIRSSYADTKQQTEELEEKVKSMEKKFEDISVRTCTIIQNICASILDPQKSQGINWKSYWQDQIKTMVEVRSSLSKSTQ
ncbi:unnamed protein product [Rotaria socialis]|uniref:CCHC-type domain-containing protein n=1 Tax=Rotaria socialis TaxID=392032 RepID=A0A821N6N9_9BILA|nr:unnamed protein product [Rotaria socialis]CAF4464867.1 unnamed protein product [Rotaria socialis]CAF4768428.1 unnamed protein product [Rotaria socialis]CAF4779214.1 unnamed protein product [Rotaria socialis]